MPARRYDVIRIRFTDGRNIFDWPILKSSQTIATRILTAGGYTIESNETRRNSTVPDRIHSHAGEDAEKGKR